MAMNGNGQHLDASSLPVKQFDGIIIGGGGSGLMSSLQLAQSGMNTAVISKVFPTRSHTVSAQGGITCAIASAANQKIMEKVVKQKEPVRLQIEQAMPFYILYIRQM